MADFTFSVSECSPLRFSLGSLILGEKSNNVPDPFALGPHAVCVSSTGHSCCRQGYLNAADLPILPVRRGSEILR